MPPKPAPKPKKSGRYAVGARVGKPDHRITIKQSKKLRARMDELTRENERLQKVVDGLRAAVTQLRKELKQERNGRLAEEHDQDQRPYIKKAWRELRA